VFRFLLVWVDFFKLVHGLHIRPQRPHAAASFFRGRQNGLDRSGRHAPS